jgi:hypothetical protein
VRSSIFLMPHDLPDFIDRTPPAANDDQPSRNGMRPMRSSRPEQERIARIPADPRLR